MITIQLDRQKPVLSVWHNEPWGLIAQVGKIEDAKYGDLFWGIRLNVFGFWMELWRW